MPDFVQALSLMKARLNRTQGDAALDNYFSARLQSAAEELNGMVRRKLDGSAADLMLLVDFAVWQYQNRDQSGAQPAWLRTRLRQRFLEKERTEA